MALRELRISAEVDPFRQELVNLINLRHPLVQLQASFRGVRRIQAGCRTWVGCAVNTVRRQLAEGDTPKYVRKVQRPTKLGAYETYLRARQESARPLWIPVTVLLREIAERGYLGGQTQVCTFLRTLKPPQAPDPVVRFETAPGEQLQVDWIEFRKGNMQRRSATGIGVMKNQLPNCQQ